MQRSVLVVVAALLCCPVWAFAQGKPIALTDKIASLDGVWIRDRTKGVEGYCGNTVDETIRIRVSAVGVSFESRRLTGLIRLDGSVTNVGGGNFSGAASASIDAGWLAVTNRHPRAQGTGISRDVFVVQGDELTVWRTFHLEVADGTLNQNACDGRQALVYVRQEADASATKSK
jgi:hypothetical protein